MSNSFWVNALAVRFDITFETLRYKTEKEGERELKTEIDRQRESRKERKKEGEKKIKERERKRWWYTTDKRKIANPPFTVVHFTPLQTIINNKSKEVNRSSCKRCGYNKKKIHGCSTSRLKKKTTKHRKPNHIHSWL